MPIRGQWGENIKKFGGSELFNWEEGLFKVVKIRQDSKCKMCEKEIKKGCYCLGGHYWKVCINCADGFIDNFIKSLNKQKNKAKELKENLKKNIGEYIKNNVINSV